MEHRVLYLGLNPPNGKNVLHYPIIRIVPRKADDEKILKALEEINNYTHLIFTSQSSVHIFCDFLPEFGFEKKQLSTKCCVAVGKATAAALRRHGLHINITAQTETAEGIVEELQKIKLHNAYVFWPRSALARPVLTDFFIAKGIKFKECIFYDTIPHQPGPLPDLNSFEEIVFTSPSTVDAFLTLFGSIPRDKQLTPLGPITRSHLSKLLK